MQQNAIDMSYVGENRAYIRCNNCYQEVVTRVESRLSSDGWMWATMCCLFGSWIGSLIACFLPGFRNFTHSCPNCNAVVAVIKPTHRLVHWLILIVATVLCCAAIVATFTYFLLQVDWSKYFFLILFLWFFYFCSWILYS